MNLLLREMKAHRRALLVWCIGVFYIVAASMWKFGAEYRSNQSLNELVGQLPSGVRVLLGMRGTFDLSTACGYYGLCYYYLTIMAAIHSAMVGAGIIAKEERRKTTEFLIAKPITRNRIITEKLLVGLLNILVFNVVTLVSSITTVGYFNHGDSLAAEIVKLMVGMFIIQLIFLLMGSAIAAYGKNPKISAPVAIVVVLLFFMIAKIADMSKDFDFLKWFTPIKYYEAEVILGREGFGLAYLMLSFLILGLLTFTTYSFYQRRDLKV